MSTTAVPAEQQYLAHNPSIFSLPHVAHPSDQVPSDTLDEQAETERVISELLLTTAPPVFPNVKRGAKTTGAGGGGGAGAAPTGTVLRKGDHLGFFQQLFFKLPAHYVALDASRPWLMYWSVHSFDLMGVALDQNTKDR
jgi:protein farnesyltransferase subunit beta